MNYQRIYYNDFVNGEGVRTTLFVSGCNHGCKGCYNASTWNPKSGEPFTEETLQSILESLKPDYIRGLSLTGGDPLFHSNLDEIINIILAIRARYGTTKDIWLWTGYTLDEVWADDSPYAASRQFIVSNCDVIVDGRFEEELQDVLKFRGSSNQVIHYQKVP